MKSMNRLNRCVFGSSAFAAVAISLSSLHRLPAADQAPAAATPAQTAPASEPATEKIVVHPAKSVEPSLRLSLASRYIDQTSGNAAVQYMRAALALADNKPYRDVASRIPDWLDLPLDQLRTHDDAQKFFNGCPTMIFDMILFAANKDYCEWELPFREFNMETRIPELQWLREMARLLALKARIEISRGQLTQAFETIKTGLAIGRHAADGPTLVSGLVGVAISFVMLHQLETLQQQPDCPSLYWSLATLPAPCIDLGRASESEQDSLYLMLPALRGVREKTLSEEQWNKLLAAVTQKMIAVMPKEQLGNGFWPNGVLAAATAYSRAKQQLRDFGYSPAKIDAMSVAQAILTATVETYDRDQGRMHRWFYLPYSIAWSKLDEEEIRIEDFDEIIPFGKFLLRSLRNIRATQARLDRQVAAMRVLEGLRLYAADHRGQLPQRLADVNAVELPNNPSTGKPFDYELRNGRGLLSSPAPSGSGVENELHWEIEMADAKK
jgi:hypothetical protein